MKSPNQYINDILTQPASLKEATTRFDLSGLSDLAMNIRAGRYDRIVITGMGTSLYAAHPAWLLLSNLPIPCQLVETGELVYHAPNMISSRSLLWAVSQSGSSAEIVALTELVRLHPPAFFLATSNSSKNPLANAANLTILLHAEVEKTVSTRTYLHSLGLLQIMAYCLLNENLNYHMHALEITTQSIDEYLADWETQLEAIGTRLCLPESLFIIGRGPSLATAECGALILKESAYFPAIGLNAAQFRHGPLEMSSPGLSAILLAGTGEAELRNLRLYQDIKRFQGRAFWLSVSGERSTEIDVQDILPAPRGYGIGIPLAEILPIQLLSIHLAWAAGHLPGEFSKISKVTVQD